LDQADPDRDSKEPPQLAEAVYGLLRSHLDQQIFPQGLVLGEAAIARALNISRTPVRTALQQLQAEGGLVTYAGRGMLVSYDDPAPEPLRRELAEAGLRVPEDEALGYSGAAERIYPQVEKALASCAAFGRFYVNQTAMANYYGISRAVAHVVLNQLERVGIVRQDRTARWYVERLTAKRAADHYFIRAMLEPQALKLAAPQLDPAHLTACWERIVRAMRSGDDLDFALVDQIECDLHYDLVHRAPNEQLVKIINESQLPLISTSYTIERYQDAEVIHGTLPQHLTVFNYLIEGNVERAADALRYHLEQASRVNTARLEKLPPLSAGRYPRYLSPAAAQS
jgi:DNA-binding GntR family transcriptional regulator